jgi:hypothetical protein
MKQYRMLKSKVDIKELALTKSIGLEVAEACVEAEADFETQMDRGTSVEVKFQEMDPFIEKRLVLQKKSRMADSHGRMCWICLKETVAFNAAISKVESLPRLSPFFFEYAKSVRSAHVWYWSSCNG